MRKITMSGVATAVAIAATLTGCSADTDNDTSANTESVSADATQNKDSASDKKYGITIGGIQYEVISVMERISQGKEIPRGDYLYLTGSSVDPQGTPVSTYSTLGAKNKVSKAIEGITQDSMFGLSGNDGATEVYKAIYAKKMDDNTSKTAAEDINNLTRSVNKPVVTITNGDGSAAPGTTLVVAVKQ